MTQEAASDAGGGRAVRARPERVLVLSANMGAGHDAAADAIQEQMARQWPGVQIQRLDTLKIMGAGVGPVFRRIYVTNVQKTPWLYEFFYSALWKYRWFARASKAVVGAWCGRMLKRHLTDFRPDLVVTTYPLATAGMAWLSRRGDATAPTAAWITDFAPHPFWVYKDVELNLVLHECCLPAAQLAEPGARTAVGALPVSDAFRTCTEDSAHVPHRPPLRVLVSCGSFGFGSVEEIVDAVLAAGPDIHVQVMCGRNAALQRRLAGRGDPRIEPLGWIRDMPARLAAADVVIGNAGGATALEAWTVGRPVIVANPIAAHGRGNAELMAEAGLSVTCTTPEELTRHLKALTAVPSRIEATADRVRGFAASATLADDVVRLGNLVAASQTTLGQDAHDAGSERKA